MQQGERVYRDMKRMIMDGEFMPGDALTEKELSTRFGASRTPVREALQRLSREGLIRIVPGRGAFVTDISIPDIIELFQMREALEPYAARLAARSVNRAIIESLLEELEGAPELMRADTSLYYALTAKMDEAVVELAGNFRLRSALDEVWTQIRRARRVSQASEQRLLDSVVEHRAILESILSGDEAGADKAARGHVVRSLQHIISVSTVGMSALLADD